MKKIVSKTLNVTKPKRVKLSLNSPDKKNLGYKDSQKDAQILVEKLNRAIATLTLRAEENKAFIKEISMDLWNSHVKLNKTAYQFKKLSKKEFKLRKANVFLAAELAEADQAVDFLKERHEDTITNVDKYLSELLNTGNPIGKEQLDVVRHIVRRRKLTKDKVSHASTRDADKKVAVDRMFDNMLKPGKLNIDEK